MPDVRVRADPAQVQGLGRLIVMCRHFLWNTGPEIGEIIQWKQRGVFWDSQMVFSKILYTPVTLKKKHTQKNAVKADGMR